MYIVIIRYQQHDWNYANLVNVVDAIGPMTTEERTCRIQTKSQYFTGYGDALIFTSKAAANKAGKAGKTGKMYGYTFQVMEITAADVAQFSSRLIFTTEQPTAKAA